MVCDFAGDEGPAAVPPEFEVKLDLPGWYAIWLGTPLMRHAADGGGGIDVALRGEPGYTIIRPEAARFHGRWAHPFNCEYACYWKCAKLDGEMLRIRIPWGTYSAGVWGMVRGCLSSLRLVRLSDQQTRAYLDDVADPSTNRVMVINDGFSGYWDFAEPGKGIDADLAIAYRNTDVGKYLLQTPSTGVASWPSKATSLVGELVGKDEWKMLRRGDRRIYEYFQWAARNEQENFRVAADVLKGSSTELHASLRMNLFFGGDSAQGPVEKLLNGKFWFEHPEMRKPGAKGLDYAIPAVRSYIIGILMELASNYDVAGINMDFTRWPPIADPARHDTKVLTSFIKEVRSSLDRVQSHKGRKLALSAHLADECYTAGNLVAQKIDLDAWLATRALDFVSVEARPPQQKYYLSIAKRHGVPYYASQDWGAKGMFPDEDPALWTPFVSDAHDPHRGEELVLDEETKSGREFGMGMDTTDDARGFAVGYEQPPAGSYEPQPAGTHDPYPGDELVFSKEKEFDKLFGGGIDPTDYDRSFAVRYAQDIQGVCLTNRFMGERTVGRMGHVEEVKQRAVTGAIWGQESGSKITVL